MEADFGPRLNMRIAFDVGGERFFGNGRWCKKVMAEDLIAGTSCKATVPSCSAPAVNVMRFSSESFAGGEPDFGVTGIDYDFSKLLARPGEPL